MNRASANKAPVTHNKPMSPSRNFIQRLASAIVLVVGAVGLTVAGLWPFVLLILVCTGILVWEWFGIIGDETRAKHMFAQAALLIAATLLAGSGRPVAGLGVLAAGAAATGIFLYVRARLSSAAFSLLPVTGIFYFGLPAVALVSLRSDPEFGLLAVLFLFMVVWCEDSAAYIVGRLVKGPKLAPSISPGKTWSGACAGIVFPVLVTLGAAAWAGHTSAAALALVAASLAFAAQLGDLAESAMKRRFGIKDASNLIPGHGGLLDRVDGLAFAAVAAGLLALLRDRENPGHALLIW